MTNKELLHYTLNTYKYNRSLGKLFFKRKAAISTKIGAEAGCVHHTGYRYIAIKYKTHATHRLVWLIENGDLPSKPNEIDHINGDTLDNRIVNLRAVSKRLNCTNRHYHRKGKLSGASYSKRDKAWRSYISIKNKYVSLGHYKTELEAHNAYIDKRRDLEL